MDRIGQGVRWKGVGLVNDLRLYELCEYYKARPRAGSAGQLVRQTVESDSLNSLGYATSWALVNCFVGASVRRFRLACTK